MQSTNQAQAITNRSVFTEVSRQKQTLPDSPNERDSQVLPLYGFDKQNKNRCWGWKIRNGRDTATSLRYDGVTPIECFLKTTGGVYMKGSGFLQRLEGFSRRSRIFPRNPTPGIDFPTTLEQQCVPRRASLFWHASPPSPWWTNSTKFMVLKFWPKWFWTLINLGGFLKSQSILQPSW